MQSEHPSHLQAALEEQTAVTTAIEHEFTAYRKQHALGTELAALQKAVVGLQTQLTERASKDKKWTKFGGIRLPKVRNPLIYNEINRQGESALMAAGSGPDRPASRLR